MNRRILEILERDARSLPARIALLLNEKEEDVAAAVAKMEAEGIIRKYKTIIDWEKSGRERVFAFIDVRVSPTRGVGFDDVAERIYKYPEVHSLFLVSGDYDLRVVVWGKTMQQVAFFVAEKLAPLDGVLSTRTSFLLKKYKDDGDVFEDFNEDDRLSVTP